MGTHVQSTDNQQLAHRQQKTYENAALVARTATSPDNGPVPRKDPPTVDPGGVQVDWLRPPRAPQLDISMKDGSEGSACPEGGLKKPREGLVWEFLDAFSLAKRIGLIMGLVLFIWAIAVELDDEFPLANDMLAIVGLVGTFWVFEVIPLPATSLLPAVLLPAAGIMTSTAATKEYWNWIQMLFLGAFIVDIAIEHVNLHRRIALRLLLNVGVRQPWLVVATFGFLAYVMSMWCSNTATSVMLRPVATGLLDTTLRNAGGAGQTLAENEAIRKYSRGLLLMVAYAASCGGVATTIGTPPNGVLAGLPQVGNAINARDWFLFACPVSLLLVFLAFTVVYLVFVRGVVIELDRAVLEAEYAGLGPFNRDEAVVLAVQLLQIFGWLSRKDLINNAMGLTDVDDATIACGAAVLLFFVPSIKRRGETILGWDVAQAHLPWGVLLLMGGGFALAKGFIASKLSRFIGLQLADATAMSTLGITYLITSAICFLTEVTSNTATAQVMLPILASVAEETLTHPLALMLPATVACSFAFLLPAATPPNSVVFASGRLRIVDFLKAGFPINLLGIVLGSPLIMAMAHAVYDSGGPFPRWACSAESCRWVDVPGVVDGRIVSGQACKLLEEGLCQLRDGTVLNGTIVMSGGPA